MIESVEISLLAHVCGGQSAGELACRTAGALVGGVGGVAANLAGYGAATLGPAIASGTANVAGGIANAAGTGSHGIAAFDTVMGVAGAVPLLGSAPAAYTMGKLGWKAGGALCGYGWR